MRTTESSREAKALPASRFSARAGRVVIAVSALASLIVFAHMAQLIVAAFHSEAGRYDFSSYYAAGAALRHDLHANIYSQAVLNQASAHAGLLVFPPLPYTYPPLFAILLSPFTALSFRVLSRVWLAGSFLLWIAVASILAHELYYWLRPVLTFAPSGSDENTSRIQRIARDPAAWVAAALASWLVLTSSPAAQTMSTGQVNFLVLIPLALVPWLTRLRNERWVGIAIAIAAMLKFTPALLIGYLVLRRRWDAVVAAVAALAVLAALSALVVGPGTVLASIPQALAVGGGDANAAHNQALFAPLLNTLGAGSSSGLALAARVVTGLGALLLAIWLFRPTAPRPAESRYDPDRENIGYMIALCAMLLISPTAWVHHYVWILPASALALGLTLRHLLTVREPAQWRRVIVELVVVLIVIQGLTLALPATWDSDPTPAVRTFLGLHLWPIMLEMRPLATLLLTCLLCWWYGRVETTAPRAESGVVAAP
ncbi:MAG TPA: glycosyltransferase family 87 protein [Ktedonobacterales bacterium]|nr:glycosyltransferase family 87 protein [Ktedonobacterales bacterium]